MDNQSKDYDTGDVKLIFKNTLDDEENGQPKKYTINAKSESAPDVFYFVHIDVDLDQIDDYSTEESDSETCSSYESESSAALLESVAPEDNPALSLLVISESSEDDSACNECCKFIKSFFNC